MHPLQATKAPKPLPHWPHETDNNVPAHNPTQFKIQSKAKQPRHVDAASAPTDYQLHLSLQGEWSAAAEKGVPVG